MNHYAALVFDLDGTLIDSAPDITAAINVYFAQNGWEELEVDFVEQFIGNGPKALLHDIFLEKGLPADEATVDKAVKNYIENYKRQPAKYTRFFNCVKEDLHSLHEAGFRLGICTNKPHQLTLDILQKLGIAHLFESTLGADAVPKCKPDPGHLLAVAKNMNLEKDTWAYIGDTMVDLQTATAANIPFYVVPWGGGAEVEVSPQQRLSRLNDLIHFKKMNISLLQNIQKQLGDLGKAERRLADFISTSPNEVIHMSMTKLAQKCEVSDPTIVRFCRRFGFNGYQDFKLHLAQSLVPSAPFNYEQIIANDSIENIVRKTCRNSLNAIQRALEDLDPQQIEAAAKVLIGASWIGIYASGISEVTALDAEHKFQRLGLRCLALLGKQKQWMHTDHLKPTEVALFFSQSGHTRQMIELAETAKKHGAKVISITAEHSTLAQLSDVFIAISPYEHTELMTPIASRLNHHLVINMLISAIAVISGSQFPDQLPALDLWLTEKIRN